MKKYLQLLLLVSLILSACTSQDKSLVGSWNLTAYGPVRLTSPVVTDSPASITINEAETLNGNSGCNRFGGESQVEGDKVTFSGLVSTLIACEEPIMSQEGAMFKVLSGVASYNIEENTLTLTSDGTLLVFAESTGQ